ncbi:UNKNOWN [Stylonychia lemnae]|uniref:RRM domain-containing protein n=1 Tax=Stylonychia lemnae TaxID=5949 RepID=A0A078A4N1_STYLE|nr:UNKNOWN [Stylonychia lemnae]|eukprot:CDW77127.1 UNKNOWN [Stylonychia lemnae]
MSNPNQLHEGKLFVGGLASSTTQDKSRGFGFVIMNNQDQVNNVLSKGPHFLDGKQIDCKRAVPKEKLQTIPKNEKKSEPAKEEQKSKSRKQKKLTQKAISSLDVCKKIQSDIIQPTQNTNTTLNQTEFDQNQNHLVNQFGSRNQDVASIHNGSENEISDRQYQILTQFLQNIPQLKIRFDPPKQKWHPELNYFSKQKVVLSDIESQIVQISDINLNDHYKQNVIEIEKTHDQKIQSSEYYLNQYIENSDRDSTTQISSLDQMFDFDDSKKGLDFNEISLSCISLEEDPMSFRTTKIFVGGLNHEVSQQELKEYFSVFGNIEECIIMVDKNTLKSRGFGFITFQKDDSVEKVMDEKEKHFLHGKWIDCKKAMPVNHQSLQKAKKEKIINQKMANIIAVAEKKEMLAGLKLSSQQSIVIEKLRIISERLQLKFCRRYNNNLPKQSHVESLG